MRKEYLPLTSDQVRRGVIFSSQLQPSETIHEVYKDTENKDVIIRRLLDDKFFNGSPYKYNEVRQ